MTSSALVEQNPSQPSIAQRAAKAAANILHLCHTLEDIRDEFIPLLPELSDKKIIEIRGTARIVGVWAWVVECACDAETLKRVEARKGGRGKKDEEQEGRLANIRQQAYRDGKGVSTLYQNAQIFNTFGLETILAHGNTLQEKGFWAVALSAPDPIEAVETFAEKKAENPFMEVQDARDEIDPLKQKHDKAKREFVEAFRTVARRAVGEWIRFTARPAIEQLKTSCPDTKLMKFWDDMDNQLAEREEAMLIEDAEPALILAWEKGYRTEPQMSDFTGLLRLEIRETMLNLQEKGYFVEQFQAWKPANARGQRTKEWKRTGKPLPVINVVAPK
jgi:hypothetical protein